MNGSATKRLTHALDEMRHEDRYPYGVFVVEALRSFGVPLREAEPVDGISAGVAEAVEAYRAAVLEADPFSDILGPIYQDENSKGSRDMSGQFFTPWSLSTVIAQMQLGDWTPGPSPSGGLWSVQDPACGSGAMLLAAAAVLVEKHGPHALLLWHIDGVDVDLTCARTCALQFYANLALREWSIGRIVVRHANSLSLEDFGTVLHASNGPDPEELPRMWAELAPLVQAAGMIRRIGALLDEVRPVEKGPAEEPAEEDGGQFALFRTEAA